tara:strand:+ start:425 stop:1513 length:1089 start_codon:yes stop_codon:yes gene_type:complete
MARNAVGGSLGSLLDGAFNEKIAGSALSLGKNYAKIKEEANFVFEENQYSFGQLSFPADLGTENSVNGHYMLFYINVPEKTMAQDNSQGLIVKKDIGTANQVNGGKIRSLNKSLEDRAQRVRTSNVICMYMPPEINVTYSADYNREDIGTLTRTIDRGFGGFFSADQLTGLAQQLGGEAFDMAAPGFAARLQAQTGTAVNNRLEMTFGGVKPREFAYTFKMTPKNEQEASDIQNIIYLFKYHMHPTIVDGPASAIMRVPSSFNIHYMYRTDENKYLNTIAESVLVNMDVKYGEGDTFKTFRGNTKGAPPRTIEISLTFNELDIHDKSTIFKQELPPSRQATTRPAGVNPTTNLVSLNGTGGQ